MIWPGTGDSLCLISADSRQVLQPSEAGRIEIDGLSGFSEPALDESFDCGQRFVRRPFCRISQFLCRPLQLWFHSLRGSRYGLARFVAALCLR